jgi:hypothetical protein
MSVSACAIARNFGRRMEIGRRIACLLSCDTLARPDEYALHTLSTDGTHWVSIHRCRRVYPAA